MFNHDLSTLNPTQATAIASAVESLDNLIESATSFVKNGGQSYRTFLQDREQLITKICKLPSCK